MTKARIARGKTPRPKSVPYRPPKRVAREIGVSGDTITSHSGEFFPVIKLGKKRFVASAAYAAWWPKPDEVRARHAD